MAVINAKTIKILVAGFLFGSFILPFIALLGMVIPYADLLKIFALPGILAGRFFIVQKEEIVIVSARAWIIMSVINGLMYSFLFALVYYFLRLYKKLRA